MIDKGMTYSPPAESDGRWRSPSDSDATRKLGGVDPNALEQAWEYNLRSTAREESSNPAALDPHDNRMVPAAGSSAVAVIRHGDRFGGERGNIGPHTVPNTILKTTARELSWFGYLLLSGGQWSDAKLVPPGWIEQSRRSSQNPGRDYGFPWWSNAAGTLRSGLPTEVFAAMGFLGNKCYVIPSLDLVIVRVADRRWPWDHLLFLSHIVESVVLGRDRRGRHCSCTAHGERCSAQNAMQYQAESEEG